MADIKKLERIYRDPPKDVMGRVAEELDDITDVFIISIRKDGNVCYDLSDMSAYTVVGLLEWAKLGMFMAKGAPVEKRPDGA